MNAFHQLSLDENTVEILLTEFLNPHFVNTLRVYSSMRNSI